MSASPQSKNVSQTKGRKSVLQQIKAAKKAEMLKSESKEKTLAVIKDRVKTERKPTGLVYHEDMIKHHCP